MRLIDADVLIEFIENRYEITWKDDYEGGIKDACTDILEKISKMPTIDAVEVVRCQCCEFRYEGEYRGRRVMMCDYMDPEEEDMMSDDDFCSKGRKNDGISF